ncbi:MAG: SUMF1/EgtB/PvdO family nonheme iron enzyme [candidate division KSB1 bacterium]|nr:SUMF1/EgtB/PvdO family nonheme iron enzyme [candidate division KSB1 bacterium]MDZ7364954.1 SUMF1/EgtB/PvdO family nonheme iron enzyme [candidate division KSB1 bacterium]MDZ7403349.1 SUMF1/EgtB/PvdO family nonheme iron enzyme [candidate division KSB1 bacterium]
MEKFWILRAPKLLRRALKRQRRSQKNPKKKTGSRRVLRGGRWYGYALCCRSAFRFFDTPVYRSDFVGFRLVFVP